MAHIIPRHCKRLKKVSFRGYLFEIFSLNYSHFGYNSRFSISISHTIKCSQPSGPTLRLLVLCSLHVWYRIVSRKQNSPSCFYFYLQSSFVEDGINSNLMPFNSKEGDLEKELLRLLNEVKKVSRGNIYVLTHMHRYLSVNHNNFDINILPISQMKTMFHSWAQVRSK